MEAKPCHDARLVRILNRQVRSRATYPMLSVEGKSRGTRDSQVSFARPEGSKLSIGSVLGKSY